MSWNWRATVKWLVKYNLVCVVINVAFLAIVSAVFGAFILLQHFSTLAFLEAGVILLVGGSLSLSDTIFFVKLRQLVLRSKEDWSPQKYAAQVKKANLYILLGILLLVESFLWVSI